MNLCPQPLCHLTTFRNILRPSSLLWTSSSLYKHSMYKAADTRVTTIKLFTLDSLNSIAKESERRTL